MTTATTVRLHKALYLPAAIHQAAEDFKDFATFHVELDGDHHVVTLTDPDPEADGDIAAEFCNFALAHTAARKRRKPG
ncbi:MAG: HxsD-like protein [Myxococcota bacterium]